MDLQLISGKGKLCCSNSVALTLENQRIKSCKGLDGTRIVVQKGKINLWRKGTYLGLFKGKNCSLRKWCLGIKGSK